jgi:hypothetical protein
VQALERRLCRDRRDGPIEALGGFFGERWHLGLDLPSA